MANIGDAERGAAVRRKVLGDPYVDAALASSDAFLMTFQEVVTEQVWARAWTGEALDLRMKALLTLGMLCALGRFDEVTIYTKAALRCGATVDEIRDALVHVAAYCGAPTARQAFLAAHAGLREAGALP